jgi:hypothetical protein
MKTSHKSDELKKKKKKKGGGGPQIGYLWIEVVKGILKLILVIFVSHENLQLVQ